MTDWVAWHETYTDAQSPLGRRLSVVQRLIHEAISANASDRLRVLSLCAGDGRDLLPVLERWKTRKTIAARLVELDERLADRARASAAAGDLVQVDVIRGDAGLTDTYVGAVPADLVLACGILGNISDDDVKRIVDAMPSLCARHGVVIWTRQRRAPDLTPAIRAWMAAAGFEERAFESPGADDYAVGMHELVRASLPLARGESLFKFIQ